MTAPPTRPLGETLVLSALVLGTTAVGLVITYAVTQWLWLVVHQDCIDSPPFSAAVDCRTHAQLFHRA